MSAVDLSQFRGKRALTYAEFVSAIRAAMPGLTRKMQPFVASYGSTHAAGVCGLSVRHSEGRWHVEQYQGNELPFALDAESSKGKALLGEKVVDSIIGQRAAERRIRALSRPDREVAL